MVDPDPPVVCNTMWALTDFTADNGATRVVPGSHRGPKPQYGGEYESVPAVMPKGSVLVWHGRLWHGGGANATGADRVGIAMNYCAGWVRQQENQQLGVDAATVATFGPRLRRLVGYGVYLGLIGHIDKRSAEQVLLAPDGRADGSGIVWDAT
jgi:ectoine hydroxylase-related dioxygenase (phytanoyl-CoA dioxygenase family)